MYRRAIVSAVDAQTARVRVRFPERQGLESGWLDVLQWAAHSDRAYGLPAIDSQVAVLMGENDEDGCVLGAIYSAADPPPVSSAAKRGFEWADGARVEYDTATKVLSVTLPSGGSLELCGASSAVALAAAVEQELSNLKSDYAEHQHQAGVLLIGNLGAPVTGVTGAPVAVTYSPGSVGSEQVKSA